MRTRPLTLVLPVFISAIILTATAGVLLAFTATRPDAGKWIASLAKIDPDDRAALVGDLLLDGKASFLVILDRQADLHAATGIPDKVGKGRFVLDALRTVAAQTQPDLIDALRARGADMRPFVIVNAIAVHGNLQSLISAATFAHTARIVADVPFKADLPSPDNLLHPSPLVPHPSPFILAPSSIEWGVSHINADVVWSLGYTGTGIVVGGQDTGVLWNHDALIDHYRGWDGASADHNFNWHDSIHADLNGNGTNPCGYSVAAPCDDNGHGTHTLGTVAGDDGGSNQIGVAPGAKWIACRNMEQGWGAPSSYLECFEWFLAPYPITGTLADGDPAQAPHIINNSWSCPSSEGCITGQEILTGVQAVRAAGILTVVAATNYGPSCSSIDEPPAIYAESFVVGAHNSSGSITSFSSRGPVTRDGSGRLKPDIAAPGFGVRSATKTSTSAYAISSGTSMAGPHVVGAAALLWDAAPYLIGEVDLTEWVLRLNATPTFTSQGCGGDTPDSHPNNVWGWGKVDALAAVSATFSLTPTAVLTHTVLSPDWVILDTSASTDPETPPDDLLVRWDFESDGVWDTPWSFNKTITGTQATIGPVAAVQVADSGGRTDIRAASAVISVNVMYLPLVLMNP